MVLGHEIKIRPADGRHKFILWRIFGSLLTRLGLLPAFFYEAGNSTARTKLLLYLRSFFRPQDLGWKFFTCCMTGWLENDSGIHQQTCNCERNHIWKHAYCSKMLVTQKRKKGRRGSKGRLGSWGRVITVSGFCCSRSTASAHCHTLSLHMVVEIAWGVNHAWCGWGPKPPSSLVVRRGKIPLLLATSSYSFFWE